MTLLPEKACGYCGSPVLWQQFPSGGFAPPYERTGEGVNVLLGVNSSDARIEYGYEVRAHHCKQENIDSYKVRKKESAERSVRYSQARQEAHKDAAPQICPKCGAEAYAPCVNLSQGAKRGAEIRWPHTERHTEDYGESQ